MRNKILPFLIGASTLLSAQDYTGRVGINTQTPVATLDIQATPNDINAIDGLVPPRLTFEQISKKEGYTQDQKGTLIYITDISNLSGVYTPQNNQIRDTGYYYWDGGKWIPFNSNYEFIASFRSVKNVIDKSIFLGIKNFSVWTLLERPDGDTAIYRPYFRLKAKVSNASNQKVQVDKIEFFSNVNMDTPFHTVNSTSINITKQQLLPSDDFYIVFLNFEIQDNALPPHNNQISETFVKVTLKDIDNKIFEDFLMEETPIGLGKVQ